jgi:hypothetical protein
MSILSYGLLLFFAAFILHIIIWRIRLPENHTKALLLLFFAVLFIGIVFHVFIAGKEEIVLPQIIQTAFLYVSIALAYIATYSAIEADSPSLVMIMNIAKQGKKGFDRAAFFDKLQDDTLVIPRIDDLLTGGFVHEEQGKLKITSRARFFIKPILMYRKAIKAGKGG